MERFTLLTIAILLFASITKAQITKGSVYLGGSIGASITKLDNGNSSVDGKFSGYSINPAIGTAVKDNLIVGIGVNYNHGKYENYNGGQNNKYTGYGGGLFLRKYYPLSNRFYVFGEGDLGYSYQKRNYLQTPGYNYTQVTKENYINATLSPGLAIHVIKSFYLETSFNSLIQIGYSSSKTTTNYSNSTSTSKGKSFSIQSSLNNGSYLNLGVRFIIPKK